MHIVSTFLTVIGSIKSDEDIRTLTDDNKVEETKVPDNPDNAMDIKADIVDEPGTNFAL